MSSKKQLDALGSRMKLYEGLETNSKFMPNLPIYVRIDGRGFSKFTSKMKRPYDNRLSTLLQETTRYLVKEFGATVGYCQSDEISLIIPNDYGSLAVFDGKKQKLVSLIASATTSYFIANFSEYFKEDSLNSFCQRLPTFDCRAFSLPSFGEASNAVLWRYLDAIKNSKQMLAHHHFSHASLQKLNGDQLVKKLENEGVIWKDFPPFFKEGVFFKKVLKEDGRSEIKSFTNTGYKEMSYDERVSFVGGVQYNDL